MLYEIINPSDPYTIQCVDLEIALVACCLLGGGQYAFEPRNAAVDARRVEGLPPYPDVPLFLFGGVEAFCQEHFSEPFESVRARVVRDRAEVLAAAFGSVVVGDRTEYLRGACAVADGAARAAYDAAWHDQHRTSSNDIGARAKALAVKLRGGMGKTAAPPQQVFGQ